jgi:hypothetical protein
LFKRARLGGPVLLREETPLARRAASRSVSNLPDKSLIVRGRAALALP